MSVVRVKVGRPDAVKLAQVEAQVSADLVKALGEAVIERVRKRVNHPAADALTVTGINQNAAVIGGPRGGPGIIRPVKGRTGRNGRPPALQFVWQGGTHYFASVNGVGLGPLIEAESNRLADSDVVLPDKTYK